MKKLNKKKVLILIILIVLLIAQIKAFRDSQANRLTEITAIIIDSTDVLNDENYILQAVNEEGIGIAITLPSVVNERKVQKYLIEEKQIDDSKETKSENQIEENLVDTENLKNKTTSENILNEITTNTIEETIVADTQTTNTNEIQNITNETSEQVQETDTIVENGTTEEVLQTDDKQNEILNETTDSEQMAETINTELGTKNIQEKKPGEKIYLTEQELENAQIELNAVYETKEKNEQILYNKVLEKQVEEHKITMVGYMPSDAQINVEQVSVEEVTSKLGQHINQNTTVKVAYDITIMVQDQEFEPDQFDENVEVTISGISTVEEEKYKVVHIDDENNTEELTDIEIQENSVIFNAKEFSTYALLSESTDELSLEVSDNIGVSLMSELNVQDTWDGSSVATNFSWGEGTQARPYLIADGDELAYLASQVNSGNTFENNYFQLAADIDLGNNTWTPIGTTQNSFRGILDGAGHTIANAQIIVAELPDQTYDSYGIFGSIGGGNSRSIIKNLELTGINVSITPDGSTAGSGWFATQDEEGIRIGCLTGTMFKNSNIENVIVSGSSITDTNTIQVYNYQFQFAVGGVVGYITNSATSNSDPSAASRYIINNCYSNVQITLDATASVSTSGWNARDGRGQYHTGGIVGTIRSQPVWPTNCLYDGAIQANGYIGPIFGGLINNTSFSKMTQVIWNGNDAGNLTTNNAYYTNYSAAGTRFTQSVTSGTSTARKSNTTSNVGYVQGVNKGSYTTNMTTMLNMFNGNVTADNGYLTWLYENNILTFKERLSTERTEPVLRTYQITVTDPYQVGTYDMIWYKNGVEDTSIQGDTYVWTPTYEQDENMVVITSDGKYYAISKFTIKKIQVNIEFSVNTSNDSVRATLTGEGIDGGYTTVADYTFQWYENDLSGEGGPLDGETLITLDNLEEGMDYTLIATNTKIPQLTTQNTFTYGERLVIFVDYVNGNNNRDGYTEATAVKNLSTAYGKLDSAGTRNTNVIVLMGNYNDTSLAFFNSQTATTYAKDATITGKYQNKDYNATLRFGAGSDFYRYLTADLTLQYLTLNGGGTGNSMYLLMQGNSLTFGEQVTMTNYQNANSNQGLIGSGNAPAVHVFAGWYQYNRTTLPNNDCKLVIKSGTFRKSCFRRNPRNIKWIKTDDISKFYGVNR